MEKMITIPYEEYNELLKNNEANKHRIVIKYFFSNGFVNREDIFYTDDVEEAIKEFKEIIEAQRRKIEKLENQTLWQKLKF